MTDLPAGWIGCALSDASTLITKGSTPTSYGFAYQSFGIPFVRVENLHGGRIDRKSIRHCISDEANQNQRRSILQPGDVLFSIAGTIGETAVVAESDVPLNTNQALAIIRVRPLLLNPEFLRYQVQSPSVQRQIGLKERGGGMNNVSLADLHTLQIRIGPFAEQHRIVAKLDALLARVNACRDRLDRIPKLLTRFRQSVLAAACSGRLTASWRRVNNPHASKSGITPGWRSEQMGNLAKAGLGAICAGPFGTIFKARDFRDEGVPIIFLRHVSPGKYLNEKPGFMNHQKWEELFKPYSVFGGELLITKLGDPPGDCAIFPAGGTPAMVTPDVIKMSVDERQVAAEYLMHFLNSPISKETMFGLAFGVTRLRIDLPMFKKLRVPIPPMAEQHAIITRVDDMFALADRLEARVAQARDRVDSLNQAILAKAFRGELVPTEAELAVAEGRAFESATQLLDRIRSLKSADVPKPGFARCRV